MMWSAISCARSLMSRKSTPMRPFDQRMVEHALEHRRVAVERHGLERVAEIAVVRVRPRRDSRRDLLVELRRVEAPLLARVAAEEEPVELLADRIDDHVLGRLDLLDRLGAAPRDIRPRPRPSSRFASNSLFSVVRLIGIGTSCPRTLRQHAMLVRPPLRELRQIVDDLRRCSCGRCAARTCGTGCRPRSARHRHCRRHDGAGR